MTGETSHFLSCRSWFGDTSQTYGSLYELAKSHASFIDLTVSNPTGVGIQLPDWGTLLAPHLVRPYSPDPRGQKSAREAIARDAQKRAGVKPEDILITASTSEAYSYLLHTLCDPGDALLVPHPSYPLFQQLAQLAGVTLVPYKLRYDGSWHVDLSSLPSRTDCQQQNIRAVVCVSPNNPTGNVLRHEELTALSTLGLPLIFDEVFLPYVSKSSEHFANPLAFASPNQLVIVLDGLSKRAAAPGLKLGWLIARGAGATELLSRLEWLGDTFLSVGAAVQHALPEILSQEAKIQTALRERIAANRAEIIRCTAQSGVTPLDTEGGWSLILRLPQVSTEGECFEALARAGVWTQPGSLYELPFENSVVVSLITEPAALASGLSRLVRVVDELS